MTLCCPTNLQKFTQEQKCRCVRGSRFYWRAVDGWPMAGRMGLARGSSNSATGRYVFRLTLTAPISAELLIASGSAGICVSGTAIATLSEH